jgi:hypothetical protein
MVETSRFIWEPSHEFIESTNVYRFIERLGIATSRDFIRYSQEHLEDFWDHLARELSIERFEPNREVLDAPRGVEWTRWFTGGRLNVNTCPPFGGCNSGAKRVGLQCRSGSANDPGRAG